MTQDDSVTSTRTMDDAHRTAVDADLEKGQPEQDEPTARPGKEDGPSLETTPVPPPAHDNDAGRATTSTRSRALSAVPSLTRSRSRPRPRSQAPSAADQHDPAFLAKWDGASDPDDPHNLSSATKARCTLILGLLAFTGSLGTSILTPAEPLVAAELGMGTEETVLLLALFVGSASARTASALLATRFLGGLFASAPISNVSAALGDIYAPTTRGVAMAFYSVCVVGGPCVAPVVGASIAYDERLGWRWVLYVEALVAAVSGGVALLGLPETYGPVLLARRAARRRRATGDARWWHPHEQERARMTLRTLVGRHLGRPLRMFVTEPIVACIALYASFAYALVFLALEVYPLVFRDARGFGPVAANLPFLALFVGAVVAVGINIANQPLYARAMARQGDGRAVPEARLPPIVLGGLLFSAGFFWFGWTAEGPGSGPGRNPEHWYHWAVPTVAGGFIGCGFNVVFQQCLNYLVDSYGPYAASATSANTVLRSLLACGLPLAARPMFTRLGVGPAASLLGAVSALALPAPIVFRVYGPRLRARSKFAQDA
ncbi:bicyclomycin resistance protein [Sporothrix brasiliensis 5110]|uniref:Bicyclomycin resistance protein n=1 Tax=Sporothrix brasiliensis 5110 TaxID=1398154 RepID=A0A0C2IR17_9PEZI|nr:bicyclomycin resistance protein [Sporothrix brasiliensis 5110]KIH89325.1 bicyclomycin resistance protein [Sporothrix brasiliensis 5110]